MIGITNKVLAYLSNECELHIKVLPEKLVIHCKELIVLDASIRIARDDPSNDEIKFKSLWSRIATINKNESYTSWLTGNNDVDHEEVEEALLIMC